MLDVLRLCLRGSRTTTPVVFDAFDFPPEGCRCGALVRGPDPRGGHVFFRGAKGDWGDELIGRLNRQKILQVREDERSHVLLRVTCAYNVMDRDFVQEWAFPQPRQAASDRDVGECAGHAAARVAYFYLAALRDAAHHFDAKGPFWRPFLKDSQLPAEKKAEIEQKLREVNDIVVASHTSFRAGPKWAQEVAGCRSVGIR